jgi:hypothetical protein
MLKSHNQIYWPGLNILKFNSLSFTHKKGNQPMFFLYQNLMDWLKGNS